jgi:hypothetical protein
MPLRRELWRRLAGDPSTGLRTGLRPAALDRVAHAVAFADLPGVFPKMLQGGARGRCVVDIAGTR